MRKLGYGGCHLNDAGFSTIDYDTNVPTDIVFIEWNTTALVKFDEKKIRYMAGVLLKKGIMPIFLILARSDSISPESKRKCEQQVKDFCSDNNLICLDYRYLINPEEDLRDFVHTNLSGAMKYANQIYSDLTQIVGELKNSPFPSLDYFEYSISAVRSLLLDVIQDQRL